MPHPPKVAEGSTFRASALALAIVAMICNCHVSVESFVSPLTTKPKNAGKFASPPSVINNGSSALLAQRVMSSFPRRPYPSNSLHRYASPVNQQFQVKNDFPSDESSKNDGSFCRKVAILIPNYPEDVESSSWFPDALSHLQQLANRLDLPIMSMSTSSARTENYYSHYLTIVPHPRTNSYALAIHANPPVTKNGNKNNTKKRQKKLKLDPFFVDLCPPMDTRMGYRMNTINKKGSNSFNDSGGGELLLKALSWKKLWAEKNAKGDNNNYSNSNPLVIYDLTAGLARDTLIILTSSFAADALSTSNSDPMPVKVHMVERDPIVAALVNDAMRRLKLLATTIERAESNSAQTVEMISDTERTIAQKLLQCLTIEESDATTSLERLSSMTASQFAPSSDDEGINSIPYPPDICYLDPMFPPRKKKSSLVKKDMAMLHSLLGTAEIHSTGGNSNSNDYSSLEQIEKLRIMEEQSLLFKACESAVKRVVVKRPIGAPPLGCLSGDVSLSNNGMNGHDVVGTKLDGDGRVRKPSYDVRGSVNRWDVYISSSSVQD